MSVCYEIRERFVTSNNSSGNEEVQEAKKTMQQQLALLLMMQLKTTKGWADVQIGNLKIELDKKRYDYRTENNSLLSEEVQRAVQGIADADEIDIDITYSYIWRLQDDYLSIGPFVLTEFLEECEEEVFHHLDYIMHNYADCSDNESAGILVVYGIRDGILVKGAVQPVSCHELPAFGVWSAMANLNAIQFEELTVREGKEQEVLQICRELETMSDGDDLSLDEGYLTYFMNNAVLKGPDALKRFTLLASRFPAMLRDLKEDIIGNNLVSSRLLDVSEYGPNVLHIDIDFSGQTSFFCALSGAGRRVWED